MSSNPTIQTVEGIDKHPVPGATLDALDLKKVATHVEQAVARGRYKGPTEPKNYLLRKKCLVEFDGQLQATLAGIMCFGQSPQDFFPRGVIDIGHFRGIETVSYDVVHLEKDIDGTIFDQLSRVESYLWTNTHHGMTLSDGSFQRVEVHEYPQIVIRELCVNMIAHRDYLNMQSAARVSLFRNRIEWSSPGGLPAQVTVENILDEQCSRNPVILSVLHEAGYVEAFGQGLNTVVNVLKDDGLLPPNFRDTGASFTVTVYGRAWEVVGGEGMFTNLSDAQRKLLSFVRVQREASVADMEHHFPDRSRRSLQRDLQRLVDARLLDLVGEGRGSRYRLPATDGVR